MPKSGSGRKRFDAGARGAAGTGAAGRLRPAGAEVKQAESELIVVIRDARSPGGCEEFDCSRWLVLPHLATAFAEALPRVLMRRNTARTRKQIVYDLTHGFFTYCASLPAGSSMTLADVDQGLVTNFAVYLSTAKKDDGSLRYSRWTCRHYLGVIRSVFDVLRAEGKVAQDLTVPRIKGHEAPSTKPMERSEYLRFIARCRADVIQCMSEIGSFWAEVDQLKLSSRNASTNISPIAFAVAHSMGQYKVLPERKWLLKHDVRLFKKVNIAYQTIMKVMHPMSTHLTPFVYYLACVTLYNTQPLLEIRLEDAIETSVLGVARLSLHPLKMRGKQYQHRSFVITQEPDNPALIIRFLARWTEHLRSCVPAQNSRDLFIYVNRDRGCAQVAEPLYDRDLGFSPVFSGNAARYTKERGFSAIGTRLLRATGADLANDLMGGDLLGVSTLLGHKGMSSTLVSYRSEHVKQRDAAWLAGGMAARDRWVQSAGKVDARSESADADRTAATPGFMCIDPYNSPIVGEKSGRLCTAYGFCPNCPLAQPAADPVYALARMLQLREVLLEARDRHGLAVWRVRFSDQLEAINTVWLPALSDDARLARVANLQLNPLPSID